MKGNIGTLFVLSPAAVFVLLAILGPPPPPQPPQEIHLSPESREQLAIDICRTLLDAGKLREGAQCKP